ncbi:MAG: tetratricopeptide repeat protein [Anaerolineae bacterium]|nr:tetratricopeptide repeat protein [Anaerolineae bacterium]
MSRLHLIEQLNEGLCLGRKLTLASAPAGFGKTTLVSAWAANCGRPVAWLSLDEGDNDPARFLTYLAAALQTVGVQVGGEAAATEAYLTALVNQAGSVDPFILVLDDYHFITAQPVHDVLAFFLDHLPGTVHLVIATRADPPLPVARLRGRGQLTELRLADLRFTPDEAAQFLEQVMGLTLAAEDVAALSSRTEGWIAGLQMAALSLQGRGDVSRFVAAFTGSNRYILDYLLEEVLRREPERVQEFLLQTSILERLCAPLCSVVVEIGESANRRQGAASPTCSLAGSQSTLEHLERANLFIVPLDDRREWYRYHRLFADLLRQRLHQMYPDRVPALHRRASVWYEESGSMAEAIDHALAAEDLDRAADLIEANAEATLMRGEVSTFLRWIGALPDDLVRARPALSVLYAWMLLWQGQSFSLIESLLCDAEKGDARVSGRATALRGLIAGLRGQTERTIELCSLALEQLPEEDRFVRPLALWLLRAIELAEGEGKADMQAIDNVFRMSQRAGNVMLSVMIACNRAEILMRQGQPYEAAATYRKAVELATDAQGRRMPIAGQALVGLGELLREWGELDAAERYLVEGIELGEQWTEVGPLEAYVALARVRWAQGNMASAWDALQKAQELAVKYDVTELDDLSVAMFRAWMWTSQGDLEPARRWAEERDLFAYIDTPLQEEVSDSYDLRIRKYELLVLARLLIAQERPGDALKLLESLIPVAEWRGRPAMLVEICALQALAYQAQGDLDRALDALECALSLAEPKGYVGIFAGEGEPMRVLLREVARRGVAVEYVGRLLPAFSGSKFQASDSRMSSNLQPETLPEPLSERELEVLRLLNAHLSNTEVAEKLFISVNTVRFHVKNIYGKLGVHRRSEAIQRAEELELL